MEVAKRESPYLRPSLDRLFSFFLEPVNEHDPFPMQSLRPDVQGGYLFLLTALGIRLGSIIPERFPEDLLELGLVPLGGLGVSISLYCLDLFSNHLLVCIPLVVIVGMFGGIYQIPLDSYIQVASPNKYRGQVVAATNFFSFFGVLCASALLYLNTEVGFSADKGFTIVGTITLFITILIGYQFFDYVSRFICMILSRLHFKTTFTGLQNVPNIPAIYVCTHTAWNDTLLMLGAQRRRMRFFIENEQDHSKWLLRLYRLLRVVPIPSIERLENNAACLKAIKQTLDKGISVCIFINETDTYREIENLKLSYSFREILKETPYPMIPVSIEKGEKNTRSYLLTRLFKKFRIPAAIYFGTLIAEGPLTPEQNEELMTTV